MTVYSGWQSSSSECKSRHNSYLLGDVDLTDPEQACAHIQGKHLGQSWLGIATEVYITNERGNFHIRNAYHISHHCNRLTKSFIMYKNNEDFFTCCIKL